MIENNHNYAELISLETQTSLISDIINQSGASKRLRNCVDTATQKGKFPFVTVQEYLQERRDAKVKLLEVLNLGNKTADEFIEIIELHLATGLPEPVRRNKKQELIDYFNKNYPGVFQPLIEDYESTPETDILKIVKLEKY